MPMELSGGEIAAKRGRLTTSSSEVVGEDCLSALPDDVLVLVLLGLGDTAAAARTSILSRRWRRIWALLPELSFTFAPVPDRLATALAAHEADLRNLVVATREALPVAARRLFGDLFLWNLVRRSNARGPDDEDAAHRGAFELPCFDRATSVALDLGFLGLAVPPAAGVFARLTELYLRRLRFHGPCELGDVVSSPRCPCLQKLTICDTQGLENLTIRSESLLLIELKILGGLRQLAVVAPVLKELTVISCFSSDQNPVANISAPQLKLLEWRDPYDPSSVHLGDLGRLQVLGTSIFLVYGPDDNTHNLECLRLLQRFKVIQHLFLTLLYVQNMDNCQYMMEDMTMLPQITMLHLIVIANGHAFGASPFHVLRMCTDIRKLVLLFHASINSQPQPACAAGCICDQPTNWKTEELVLNRLEEVEVRRLRGSEHEFAFVKQLFSWATVLKKMKITFDYRVTESMAEEVCQVIRSFSRPEICIELYA